MATYLWREEIKKSYYRFQTDEKTIADKMKRRKNFEYIGSGLNCSVWFFQTKFKRFDMARNTLKALTGNTVNFNKKDDIYFSL